MKILVVEPGQIPYETEIPQSLGAMQALVGGTIQAVYPFPEPVALVCNDEGKMLGLPLNRTLYDWKTGEPYDIVAGTFFLCGAPPDSDNFVSLSPEEIRILQERFCQPEEFVLLKENDTDTDHGMEVLVWTDL